MENLWPLKFVEVQFSPSSQLCIFAKPPGVLVQKHLAHHWLPSSVINVKARFISPDILNAVVTQIDTI